MGPASCRVQLRLPQGLMPDLAMRAFGGSLVAERPQLLLLKTAKALGASAAEPLSWRDQFGASFSLFCARLLSQAWLWAALSLQANWLSIACSCGRCAN